MTIYLLKLAKLLAGFKKLSGAIKKKTIQEP